MIFYLPVFTTFIPHNLDDLRVGQHIRFLTNSKLMNGVIRFLDTNADLEGRRPVGVETAEKLTTDLEWTKWFKWLDKILLILT